MNFNDIVIQLIQTFGIAFLWIVFCMMGVFVSFNYYQGKIKRRLFPHKYRIFTDEAYDDVSSYFILWERWLAFIIISGIMIPIIVCVIKILYL